MENPIIKWHEVVKNRDYNLLESILADDIIFYSPVVYTPQKGKQLALQYLMAASEVFNSSSFKYDKEVIGSSNASLEFSLTLDNTDINGIDLISWDESGKILEFKVFIRPLQGVNMIHKLMQGMLESFKNVS
jgi:hypothetical protein|tara:strand:- start:1135 stop:1530 length:396 start_codon:yes stop_codon:yes gene_type:complete